MNATEMHRELIDAGWRIGLDGYWRSPDPHDIRFMLRFGEAWAAYQAGRGNHLGAAIAADDHLADDHWG